VKVSWNVSEVTAVEQAPKASAATATFSASVVCFFSLVTCFCSDLTCVCSERSVGPLFGLAPAAGTIASDATAANASAFLISASP